MARREEGKCVRNSRVEGKDTLLEKMILFDNEATYDPAVDVGTVATTKSWQDIGNGLEVLAQTVAGPKDKEDDPKEKSKEDDSENNKSKVENSKEENGKEENAKEENAKEENAKEENGKEEKSKEENAKEEKSKEENAKEENGKEEKSKEENAKEENAKEEKSKEENAKEENAKEEKSKEEKSKEESKSPKQEEASLVEGNLVFYTDKWLTVQSLKEDKAVLKSGEENVEAALIACQKSIPLRIFLCNQTLQTIQVIYAKGKKPLDKLFNKLAKNLGVGLPKARWFCQGKQQAATATVSELGLKPHDKLLCLVVGYDVKTYKRFKKLDDRGWYLSRSSKDAITFVPSRAIGLVGFGMYHTRTGPGTYTIKYKLTLNDSEHKSDTVELKNPENGTQVMQIFINADQSPVTVQADTEIGISVEYTSYEEASRLLVGTDGEEVNEIEGNESDLFKVTSNSESGNGTDTNAGQIPELYYVNA